MEWAAAEHSAHETEEYLFHQLIPYIGNKRKLLSLIEAAVTASGINPESNVFVDLFAGTGVVSRFARQLGYRVIANDWEPYAEIINRCYLEITHEPAFFAKRSYASVIEQLNDLPPREDWVTQHLCPLDDENPQLNKDRLFYMRKNGMRIDAIRHQIDVWDKAGDLDPQQKAALLAPLLYQSCYNSNTSGVFKGFHNGWGGRTGTALYRIQGDLSLRPARFLDNGKQSIVHKEDAQSLAEKLTASAVKNAFVYLDPPYNQHPYGANYHVLNSVALWDKPALSPQVSSRGDKSAIRKDWRTERRSAYNYASEASKAYSKLVASFAPGTWLATSYSTDGMIPLREMIAANHALGDVSLFTRPYKRYRVSTQRYSIKPLNIEFIVLTHVGAKPSVSAEELVRSILEQESMAIERHTREG